MAFTKIITIRCCELCILFYYDSPYSKCTVDMKLDFTNFKEYKTKMHKNCPLRKNDIMIVKDIGEWENLKMK